MKETKITITVRASARSNEVLLGKEDNIIVRTTTAPEKGKANTCVRELLSDALRIPKRSITILHGETSSKKIVAIEGLSEEEIRSRVKNKKSHT